MVIKWRKKHYKQKGSLENRTNLCTVFVSGIHIREKVIPDAESRPTSVRNYYSFLSHSVYGLGIMRPRESVGGADEDHQQPRVWVLRRILGQVCGVVQLPF